MGKKYFALGFLAALLSLIVGTAYAKPLISDLSQHKIEINSGFTGTQIILFGARQSAGDVVVVIRGPKRHYVLRKKERVAGIWVNRHNSILADTPDYYAVATSKPLELLLTPALAEMLDIGIPHLGITERIFEDEGDETDLTTNAKRPLRSNLPSPLYKEFRDAFVAYQQARGTFRSSKDEMTFMGDTLFKTTLQFPDTLPRGIYTAETYLFHNGKLISMMAAPLVVQKSGFDAVIYDIAHQHPTFYGILAVVLAVSAGWLASAIFRRL